ncbi:PKD domain-containing protein [Thermoproteota archaeon]
MLISLLLISAPVTLFSTPAFAAEPYLTSILNELGYTNITLSDIETFPSGIYNATLLAEFGEYNSINLLNYYPIETSDYQTIFSGPEGATGSVGGYVVPPVSKMFVIDSQFGLSMLSPYRYFSEHWRNPDYPEEHTWIFENLDSPGMFLIGFEDTFGGHDRDFNDMVFSLVKIFPPEIVNVEKSPETPSNNQSVTITAQVTKGSNEIESVILSYQISWSSWTNVTMNLKSSGYVAEIPVQPYNTIVNYKVYASDTKGYSDVSQIDSYTIFIEGSSPIVVLSYSPPVADTGEVVEFDASGSYDPNGSIVSYSWDFGDGITATGAIVNHSYTEDGEYTINIKVIDNEDLVGNKVAIQVVKNRPPVAALTESASIISDKESISFDASPSYDLDGSIISYTWSFGDGTAETGIVVTHTYTEPGFYSITLTVSDNDGAIHNHKHSLLVVNVLNKPPVASFNSSAEIVNIDEPLAFDASDSYDSDGTIVSYSWDFGDGTRATGITADHAYTKEGTYTVTLTVTDNEQITDTITNIIVVTTQPILIPNQNPVASITESSKTISSGENIHFDGSESTDPDGTVVSYSWDFGDGNTATGIEVDHIFQNAGVHTVTLTIRDNDGATYQATTSITVTKTEDQFNNAPVALIVKSTQKTTIEQIISFDASDSYDSDGTIVTYLWDFGDGTITTGVTSDHTYIQEGTYAVTLTVTDNDDESSSTVSEIIIETETENSTSLGVISGIGLGITALTATLLLGFSLKRKKKKTSNNK